MRKENQKVNKGGERGFRTHEVGNVPKLAPMPKLAQMPIFAQCGFWHLGANFPALFFFHSSSALVVTPFLKHISFKPFQICGNIFVHYSRPINI